MLSFCATTVHLFVPFQWCVCSHKGQESPCRMFQVCHLWHIVEKPRLFQFEQQIVLRHSCENGRNPKPTARYRGIPSSAHSAVSIDMIVFHCIFLREAKSESWNLYCIVEKGGKHILLMALQYYTICYVTQYSLECKTIWRKYVCNLLKMFQYNLFVYPKMFLEIYY